MNYTARNTCGTAPRSIFVALSVVMFFMSLSVADSIGFVPNYINGDEAGIAMGQSITLAKLPMLGQESQEQNTSLSGSLAIEPARIKIDAISMDLPVQNVSSRDVGILDNALSNGPVRYMDSAKLNENGNMLIFAHSSHLPVVRNKMYQAFNRVPELKAGDSISVIGTDGREYLYSVIGVHKANTESVIDLSPSQGAKLTLSTCDTLTSKDARYVAEADLVGVAGE